VDPEAERMAGRTGMDGEHLIAFWVVCWSRCGLKLTPSEFERQPIGSLKVVHMQIEVHLLLLGTGRPIRCHMVRGKLHTHDPLVADHDAVPVLVPVHYSVQEASPKRALGFDVTGIKHNHSPDDLHVCSRPVFRASRLKENLDRPEPWCHVRWMVSIFEAAGGDAGLMRLAEAWHRRVLVDQVVSHAFEHGYHADHTRRLAAYWAEALGGPSAYTHALGSESAVVRMHSGNGPHVDMDERALVCFDEALTDAGFTREPLRTALHDYFLWATSNMSRYPDSPDDVPDDLRVPLWSWDGPTV